MAVRTAPVVLLVSVTVTLGIAAPDGSVIDSRQARCAGGLSHQGRNKQRQQQGQCQNGGDLRTEQSHLFHSLPYD